MGFGRQCLPAYQTMTNLYATDGKCHNAEPGTFSHECGKPATWIGRRTSSFGGIFESGFCDHCKEHGFEAHDYSQWRRINAERDL